MSRRRNRNRSLTNSSRHSQRPLNTPPKLSFAKTTAHSLFLSHQHPEQTNYDCYQTDKVFHKNISFYRQNFNPTDRSQLPFMSSLRQPHAFKSQGAKTITVCNPFEAALKTTANQKVKKQVSDFTVNQRRLSVAYYRWHKGSGRNNKWSTEFECSLRDYKGPAASPEKQFYPFVKPITYSDVEPLMYQKSEMICPRHHRSFKVK